MLRTHPEVRAKRLEDIAKRSSMLEVPCSALCRVSNAPKQIGSGVIGFCIQTGHNKKNRAEDQLSVSAEEYRNQLEAWWAVPNISPRLYFTFHRL